MCAPLARTLERCPALVEPLRVSRLSQPPAPRCVTRATRNTGGHAAARRARDSPPAPRHVRDRLLLVVGQQLGPAQVSGARVPTDVSPRARARAHPIAAPLFPLSARAARRAARAPRALRHLKMAYSETNTREPLHVRNGRGEKSETSGSAYATSDNANCPPLNCAPQHHIVRAARCDSTH